MILVLLVCFLVFHLDEEFLFLSPSLKSLLNCNVRYLLSLMTSNLSGTVFANSLGYTFVFLVGFSDLHFSLLYWRPVLFPVVPFDSRELVPALTLVVPVKIGIGASLVPPGTSVILSTVEVRLIVISVFSGEWHAVVIRERVTGISRERTNSESEVVLFTRHFKLPILSPGGLPLIIGQFNAQDCISALGKSMDVFITKPEIPLLIKNKGFVNQRLYLEAPGKRWSGKCVPDASFAFCTRLLYQASRAVYRRFEPMPYLPTVPIFDFQNLQKSGRPDFLELQPVNIPVFKLKFKT